MSPREALRAGDSRIAHLLVENYGRTGRITEAIQVFNSIPEKNVHSWNLVISAFAQCGHDSEAIACFRRMQWLGFRPDAFTLTTILGPFSSLGSVSDCKWVHSNLEHVDAAAASALIQAYGKCSSLNEAESVLCVHSEQASDVWNSLLTAYLSNGLARSSLQLFQMMQLMGVKPDVYTLKSVAAACGELLSLKEAVTLIRQIKHSVFLESLRAALVQMFGRLGCVELASEVFQAATPQCIVLKNVMLVALIQNGRVIEALEQFEKMVSTGETDVITWTNMITCFIHQAGASSQVYKLLCRMSLEGVKVDRVSLIELSAACATTASMNDARTVHQQVIHSRLEYFTDVANSLFNMYSRCGGLEEARCLFARLDWRRDVISWSSMIEACAQHGFGREALDLFQEMQLEGFQPTSVTILSVLSACKHAGFLMEVFYSLDGIAYDQLTDKHLSCIMDMLKI